MTSEQVVFAAVGATLGVVLREVLSGRAERWFYATLPDRARWWLARRRLRRLARTFVESGRAASRAADAMRAFADHVTAPPPTT